MDSDRGGDEQDRAEQLDESEITTDQFGLDPDDDALGDYPPDELQGADQYGTTPQEERIDEPMAERELRYEPDPAAELEPDPGLDFRETPPPGAGEPTAGPTGDPEQLGLLDAVPGEPEEVPTDPMGLELLGEDQHPVPPGDELEAEVATETEAYESEDPPYGDVLPDQP